MRKYSAHIGYQFLELPFEQRFEAAHRAGFAAVEAPAPYATPATQVARMLDDLGLVFVQMASPAGSASKGEKGYAAIPEKLTEFRASIPRVLDYADEIKCPLLHAMAGVIHGDDHEAAWDTYLSNLEFVASAAAKHQMAILIEPMSAGAVPGYFIDTFEKALKALEAVSADNIYILLDTYHCIMSESDPSQVFSKHADVIRHIHVADCPGRHEPGTGTVDFSAFFATLESSSYKGYIGCEYIPLMNTSDGLGWLERY